MMGICCRVVSACILSMWGSWSVLSTKLHQSLPVQYNWVCIW